MSTQPPAAIHADRAGAPRQQPHEDPWTTAESTIQGPSETAPRTFDPCCTHRLPNGVDEDNTYM